MSRFVTNLIDLRLDCAEIGFDFAALLVNPLIVGLLEPVVDISLDSTDLDHRFVGLADAISDAERELKPLAQLGNGDVLHPRIDLDLEALGLCFAIGGQPNLIATRNGHRPVVPGSPKDPAVEVSIAGVPEVPEEAVRARRVRR